jgi:hypothetical protein
MLKLFENKVLSKLFWPKKEEETGGRRKLHNNEFYDM